jgi:hypothetical protein
MTEVAQELMTPHEAARWFRRSPSWLRQQHKLLRVGGPGGQPLYHVRVCRAYVLAQLCGLDNGELRRVQIDALSAACGLTKNTGISQVGLAPDPTQPKAQRASAVGVS